MWAFRRFIGGGGPGGRAFREFPLFRKAGRFVSRAGTFLWRPLSEPPRFSDSLKLLVRPAFRWTTGTGRTSDPKPGVDGVFGAGSQRFGGSGEGSDLRKRWR
jgi:hypothetical protein